MRRVLAIIISLILLFVTAYADEIDDFRLEMEQEWQQEQESLQETEQEDTVLWPTLDDVKAMAYGSWSNLTVEQLEKGLKYDLKPLAEAYITAEKTYNINAVIKAAQDAVESDWGRSCFRKNNISGFFTDADFWSKEECIYWTCEKLEEWYVQPPHEECDHNNCEVGKHFEGRTIYDVTINYCPVSGGGINYKYGDLVSEIAFNIYKDALSE